MNAKEYREANTGQAEEPKPSLLESITPGLMVAGGLLGVLAIVTAVAVGLAFVNGMVR